MLSRLNKVGILMAACMGIAMLFPLLTFSPNRIAAGQAVGAFAVLPAHWLTLLLLCICAALISCSLPLRHRIRLGVCAVAISVLCLSLGVAGNALLSTASPYARVSPASGFWLILAILAVLLTDTIVRLHPSPRQRLLILALCVVPIAVIFQSGQLDALSLLVEYGNRKEIFWREAVNHITLALGSLAFATAVGIPLGFFVYRHSTLRSGLLSGLSLLQTIPSMALFGLLIAPLGWLAAHSEVAHAIGIRGIGMPPAFVALFLYSLLPMVANTVSGLSAVPADVNEAATGMGMTSSQRLLRIEAPLAMPIILTGMRIVLVQNIGLATIAALIGGGGLGVFVFQGLGQNATDLILLGALPTVGLAFMASVLLNICIDISKRRAP